MVRDHFKDERYFGTILAIIKKNLDDWRQSMSQTAQPTFNQYYVFANGLNDYISMAYSFGWPTNDLVPLCAEMLENYALSIEPGVDYSDGGGLIYSELLEIISKGVLLNTKNALRTLAGTLLSVGYRDYLICYLLRYADPDVPVPDELLWPDDAVCNSLRKITRADTLTARAAILHHLDHLHFTKENLEDDYNSHKRANNSYKGYWSFESAAVAKIMDFNDDILKDHQFYPFDMRHGDSRSLEDLPPLSQFAEESSKKPETPVAKRKWWKIW